MFTLLNGISAPSSGPVNSDMSSSLVGGAHVKAVLHTLHSWCRASPSQKRGCVGWDTCRRGGAGGVVLVTVATEVVVEVM